MSKAAALCELLGAVMSGAPRVGGRIFLNEEALYKATTQIKRALAFALRGGAATTTPPVFEKIKNLELCIEGGNLRFFGKVCVQRQPLDEHLALLEAELSACGEPHLVWQELRQFVAAGKPFFGKMVLDEGEFYAATMRLKKSLLSASSTYKPPQWFVEAASQIDNLENFIEAGNPRCFGSVGVRQQGYTAGIAAIRASLLPLEPLLPD